MELLEGAVKHHVMLCPLATTKDIVENPQLAARDFWVELSHQEKGAVTYPGAFAKSSEEPLVVSRRAPLLGEHTQEVFGDILGLSEEEIRRLQEEGVI
jgi:crotonobetainyl-CoA:carnitine CoA-transferase CaiB-like acyl-CoA transferase